jgi:hypothetical protein
MTRARKVRNAPNSAPFHSLTIHQRVAWIRFHLDWQGSALLLEYNRLSSETGSLNSFAQLADMDFLIIVVRRILRVAQKAKGSGLDTGKLLKSIVTDFENRWERILIDMRNELGHVDQPKVSRLFVPMRSTAGELKFLLPSGSIDLRELFSDTDKLCRVIAEVIRPYESAASAP